MKGKTNMGGLKSLINPHSLPVTKQKAEWKVHLMILTRLLRWPFGVNKLPCPTPKKKKKIPLLYQKIFLKIK